MEAALHAVLGQHDRGAGVFARRRIAASSSSELTGSSCDVGSSSRSKCGCMAMTAARVTFCSSPPESVSSGGAAKVREAEAHERLLHEARDGAALDALVLEAEVDLAFDGGHHRLALGVLEHQADAAEILGSRAAGVELVHQSPGRRTYRRGW